MKYRDIICITILLLLVGCQGQLLGTPEAPSTLALAYFNNPSPFPNWVTGVTSVARQNRSIDDVCISINEREIVKYINDDAFTKISNDLTIFVDWIQVENITHSQLLTGVGTYYGFIGGGIDSCINISELTAGFHLAVAEINLTPNLHYSYTWGFEVPSITRDSDNSTFALERIESIAHTPEVTRLDLSHLALTRLPPEIGDLQHLRILELDFNSLQSLPSEIGNLSNLQTLTIRGNDLRRIPPEMGNLRDLEILILESNPIRNLPPEIGDLESLHLLDLTAADLNALPTEIGNLSNLREMLLFGNEVDILPSEISNLNNLQLLDLRQNSIGYLPPEIGTLSDLQILNLDQNSVIVVPPEIRNLSNLYSLNLSRNLLTSIPTEIGELNNLQTLTLDGNQLTSIPPEIGNLSNLQELSLAGNNLSSLPPEIGNLGSLQFLYLAANQLTSLPPEIGNLDNLCVLGTNGNLLQTLPSAITNLQHLVDGQGCPPYGFGLDLGDNPFTALPDEVRRQGTASVLDYLQNPTWWYLQPIVQFGIGFVALVVAILLISRWRRRQIPKSQEQ